MPLPMTPITTSDVSKINKIEARRSWSKVKQFSGMEGLRITMKNLSQMDL
jgi:hypothetical protein